jgi:quinol monooxygenase YgiN
MILMSVTMIVPLGQRLEIIRALRSMLGPTRVEPGCLSCRLCEDTEKEGMLCLLESWDTAADFRRRLRSEEFRRLLMILDLSSELPRVQMHIVTRTLGMETIFAARGGSLC